MTRLPRRNAKNLVRNGTVFSALLLLCVLAAACGGRTARPAADADLLQDPATLQLQGELVEFHLFFDQAVDSASDRIRQGAATPRKRRLAVLWRVRMDGYLREIQRNEVPQAALLDYWALAVRQEEYFTSGDGIELFESQQGIAIDVAEEIRLRAEDLAARHIPEETYAQVAGQIAEYAATHPFTGEFVTETGIVPFSFGEVGSQAFSLVVGLPLAPFRTLGRVGEGADSFRVFAQATDRFSNQMATLPADIRSQIDLIILELEENPRVISALASLEEAAASSTRYAEIGEGLPDEVRATIREAFEQSLELQPEVQQTLQQAEAVVKETQGLTGSISELVDQLDRLGATWRDTAEAFTGLAQEVAPFVERDPDAPPPDPDARPFDIEDYIRTGQTAGDVVREVRALLADLAAAADAGLLPDQVARTRVEAEATLAQTTAELRQLMDRLILGLGLLALWIFVLFAGYRLVVARKKA